MKRSIPIFVCCLLVVLSTSLALAQQVLYEERFTNGVAALTWLAGFGGDVVVPYQMSDNPSGDGWVGKLNNQASGGGVGLSFAGSPDLGDYSMEAYVYCVVGVSQYNGIQVRIDSSANSGYQLLADFDQDQRLRFRYAVGAAPSVIHDFSAGEVPGGIPTQNGWHKMKIKAVGDQFWLYWDDQELPGCPYTDTRASTGFFGFYVFNFMGSADTFCDDIIVRQEGAVGVESKENAVANLPERFCLFPNYPNPFNPETNITYDIPSDGFVTLEIYDLLGRKIRTLVNGNQEMGRYTVLWDGRDESGQIVSSGVYLYKLRAGSFADIKKMILIN